jgi:hypothetical protein
LTTNQNRYELNFDNRVWSVDALHDNGAMSKYATLTALSESPVAEGELYAGSDDGLIHSTTDGGTTWSRAQALPGVPPKSFINDVEASLFVAGTVFAVADAHKVGDFSPYVFVSRDHGGSWRSIAGDLPEGTIAWAIQQDHLNRDLLFLGTEFGVYFTLNGGENWHKLSGAPTIAFRDIKLQRRDNDLVGATFGRGFYILDDYSALRSMAQTGFGDKPELFPVRDAWWYIPSAPMQAVGMPTLGSDSYASANPDFGAVFTYFLDKPFQTAREQRHEVEAELRDEARNIPFPGWDRLTLESLEAEPRVMILVRDEAGNPVRWLEALNEKGTHRVSWDLRFPAVDPIDLSTPEFAPPWETEPQGPLAAPGAYSAQLIAVTREQVLPLGETQPFNVKPVHEVLPGSDYGEVARYQQETSELLRDIMKTAAVLDQKLELLSKMKAAAMAAPRAEPTLFLDLDRLVAELTRFKTRLSGDPIRRGLSESTSPSIQGRAYNAANTWRTTQAATSTQRSDFAQAQSDFAALSDELDALLRDELERLKQELVNAGAPGWL